MYCKQRGFTLIELMVTIAVLAILLGVAAPSFYHQIQNNRSAALGEEFASALNYARGEAVKRGERISLCASADGSECGGAWDQGWILFRDGANSDTGTPSIVTGGVLQRWPAPGSKASVAVTRGGSNAGYLRFNRMGLLDNGAGNPATASLSYSGCSGESARTITVSPAGMISISRTNCQ